MTNGDETPLDIEVMRSMLRYFWEEKGDIERWIGYDEKELEQLLPHILHLWKEYREAKRRFDAAIKEAGQTSQGMVRLDTAR